MVIKKLLIVISLVLICSAFINFSFWGFKNFFSSLIVVVICFAFVELLVFIVRRYDEKKR